MQENDLTISFIGLKIHNNINLFICLTKKLLKDNICPYYFIYYNFNESTQKNPRP